MGQRIWSSSSTINIDAMRRVVLSFPVVRWVAALSLTLASRSRSEKGLWRSGPHLSRLREVTHVTGEQGITGQVDTGHAQLHRTYRKDRSTEPTPIGALDCSDSKDAAASASMASP
jgi:hypothetical protein